MNSTSKIRDPKWIVLVVVAVLATIAFLPTLLLILSDLLAGTLHSRSDAVFGLVAGIGLPGMWIAVGLLRKGVRTENRQKEGIVRLKEDIARLKKEITRRKRRARLSSLKMGEIAKAIREVLG